MVEFAGICACETATSERFCDEDDCGRGNMNDCLPASPERRKICETHSSARRIINCAPSRGLSLSHLLCQGTRGKPASARAVRTTQAGQLPRLAQAPSPAG